LSPRRRIEGEGKKAQKDLRCEIPVFCLTFEGNEEEKKTRKVDKDG